MRFGRRLSYRLDNGRGYRHGFRYLRGFYETDDKRSDLGNRF